MDVKARIYAFDRHNQLNGNANNKKFVNTSAGYWQTFEEIGVKINDAGRSKNPARKK